MVLTDIALTITQLLIGLYIISVLVILILENRDPDKTVIWILIFLFLPVISIIIYLYFGQNWKKKRFLNHFRSRKLLALLKKTRETLTLSHTHIDADNLKDLTHRMLSEAMRKITKYPLCGGNRVKILRSGNELFHTLLNDLKSAKSFIHIETYVLKEDNTTQKIKQILIDRARSGIEVKIIYDYFGGYSVSQRFRNELRTAGVKIEVFFSPLSLFSHSRLNYRIHRKLIIIDGQKAYTGGMNLAEEYSTGKPRFDSWHDLHCRLEGESVLQLESIFLYDWYLTTRDAVFKENYFPKPVRFNDNKLVQIIPSGPELESEPIKHLFLTMISKAKKSIHIMTPYFIPDESIHQCLKNAAILGIDVKIIFLSSKINHVDKRLPYYAAMTYFEDLLSAGVSIYQYESGFMHTKLIVVDGETATFGSANMDIRSLQVNFELNLVVYDKKDIEMLDEYFAHSIRSCSKLDPERFKHRNIWGKFRDSIARLLSPIL